ncbi:MAG TPA: DUF5690 family protein [Pirellulales bacterium]|nr:DUF5690 family protein [Pirellulales bacterium]
MNRPNENRLAKPAAPRSDLYWAIWSVVAAFGTYFCMYAFRKPFSAASFEGPLYGGATLKTILVTAQVMGYMVSKFIGIKVIAAMPSQRRAVGILLLIVCAELALVLFGLVPRPWNAVCLFANGLPLGMVFGLVLGFLEGRRSTEALTAGLCASFILADGVVKSVGAWLLAQGIAEDWMPSVAGLLFLVPLMVGVFMLSKIPPPTTEDIVARAARAVLNHDQRWSLFRRYAVGISLIVTMYLVVTILRSFRADFATELWQGLGAPAQPSTFSLSEICVALGVLCASGCTVLVRDNRRAFFLSMATCGAGFGLLLTALVGRQSGALQPFGFMVLAGLGLYLPYVAIHTTVFERLLAMTRDRGNLGFLMYLADAFGYLGYVAVMLLRHALTPGDDMVEFFTAACWGAAIVSAVCLLGSWRYFGHRSARATQLAAAGEAA